MERMLKKAVILIGIVLILTIKHSSFVIKESVPVLVSPISIQTTHPSTLAPSPQVTITLTPSESTLSPQENKTENRNGSRIDTDTDTDTNTDTVSNSNSNSKNTSNTSNQSYYPKLGSTRKTVINLFSPFVNFGGPPIPKGYQVLEEIPCPASDCVIIHDPDRQNTTADIFVLYNLELSAELIHQIQAWRKPHQLFLFEASETPVTMASSANLSLFDNFFNYTYTYRLDSDFRLPYQWFRPKAISTQNYNSPFVPASPHHRQWPVAYDEDRFRTLELPILKKLNYSDRPNYGAWIVSNCRDSSNRKRVFKVLRRRFRNLHAYGNGRNCVPGQRRCIQGNNQHGRPCQENMQNQYKFFMGFENSFCNDYITEKAFQRMKEGYLVVVMGQANYSNFLPPHSYINVLDFKTIADLGTYLEYLTNNETAYLSYFWWMQHYTMEIGGLDFCGLCQKLSKPTAHSHPQTVENTFDFWVSKAECNRDKAKLNEMFPVR